jgi:predicted metal-dependent hydrolase
LSSNRRGSATYKKYKEIARALVYERITYLNTTYNVPIKRVAIRNSRSRWGSCSTKGNLNFNYRLVFLPLHLVDYVVAHELCHLIHFNHSPNFWAEVAKVAPDWKERRRQLRTVKMKI